MHRRARLGGSAAALLLAVLSAGCGSDSGGKAATLPPITATPTPTGTKGLSDKQQIRKLYLDYDARSDKAQDLGTAEWRGYLSQWLIDPSLQISINALENQRRKGLRVTGHRTPHIASIRVHGDKAVLHDCSDLSKVDVIDTRTDEIVDDYPKQTAWTTVKLKKTDAGWRIYTSDGKFVECRDR